MSLPKDYSQLEDENESLRERIRTLEELGEARAAIEGEALADSLIDEFAAAIPEYIASLPPHMSNGTSRNEYEYKHICFAMGREIKRLRERVLEAAPREAESRSQLKRKAVMRGEPMPTFGAAPLPTARELTAQEVFETYRGLTWTLQEDTGMNRGWIEFARRLNEIAQFRPVAAPQPVSEGRLREAARGAKCECICGCECVAMKPDTVPYLCSVCTIREMRGDGEFHHLKRGAGLPPPIASLPLNVRIVELAKALAVGWEHRDDTAQFKADMSLTAHTLLEYIDERAALESA